MSRSVQGAPAPHTPLPITVTFQTRYAATISSQQETENPVTAIPLPASTSQRLNRSCKAKTSSIVMGMSVVGILGAIALFCLGISKRNKDGSSDIPNSLTNSSLALFPLSILLTAVSLGCSVETSDSM